MAGVAKNVKWQNADGLQVPFGNYWADASNFTNLPRELNTMGAYKQVVIDYDLAKLVASTVNYPDDLNNDGTTDGFDTGRFYFPANSAIVRAHIFVKVAAAGGTSIKLGTFQLTGTAIDDDFIVTATEGAVGKLDLVGAHSVAAGVGVVTAADETAGVGTADAYLAFTTSGTFTAGQGQIVIEYISPVVDS